MTFPLVAAIQDRQVDAPIWAGLTWVAWGHYEATSNRPLQIELLQSKPIHWFRLEYLPLGLHC